MRKFIFLLLLTLLLAVPNHTVNGKQPGQFTPTITANEIDVSFPESATFSLAWDAADITAVTLRYAVRQFSCLDATSEIDVEFSGSSASWTWEMVRSGNPPPGATLEWEWVLTNAAGEMFSAPAREYTFVDDRYDWQTVATDKIRLHWYAGRDVGPMLLESAMAGLEQLENEMEITLSDEVQFFIYGDANDMRDAVLTIQDWAGGVAFTEYNIILIGVSPDSAASWGRPTVRHELAHLVIAQYGRSCLGGSRPTWLEEGLAVYAEGTLAGWIADDIARATKNNSFAPLRTLNGSFSAHSEDAGIAYSQSYSVVNFMLTEYGQEKMQTLLLSLAAGATYDGALQEVYGVNIDGLEQAWRASLGLPARDIPPTATPIRAAAVPTIVLQGAPASVATPPSAAATAVPPSSGASLPVFCNLLVLPLSVAGLFWHRRRRSG